MSNIAEAPTAATEQVTKRRRINLGFDRFSGVYVWIGLIILFSIWIPDLFLNVETFQNVLSNEAITALVAIAFVVPAAAGAFDLTIPSTMTVTACFTAWALLDHRGITFAVVGSLLIGVAVGLANSLVIVRLRVDSFIATLGMSSILAAIAFMITNGEQFGLPADGFQPFLDFGRNLILGLPLPVYYMAAVALVLWWMLDQTPFGRHLYAVGGNPTAARLAGIRTGRVRTISLLISATVGALTGVILCGRLGIATPELGGPYLLPAFSAVFLGATQIRPGRVNVLGTLVAIFLLATGVKGLQLAGAPSYVTDLFNGLALIVAVSLAMRTGRSARH